MPFSLDKKDAIHIAKVASYSLVATIIAILIILLDKIHVDPKYLFLVPIINSFLVALERYFLDKQKQ